ncbi:Potassium-transporting ATPase B chain [Streptomyces sp. ADI91-18]|nr:Potassium-transporting ATPase B chain [Streptomyces sp. ADI91-18]
MDRMIALVEGASRQKTPNEIALNILLAALTVIFILVVVSLQPMAAYAGAAQSTTVLVALLVTLIPRSSVRCSPRSASRAWTASSSATSSR